MVAVTARARCLQVAAGTPQLNLRQKVAQAQMSLAEDDGEELQDRLLNAQSDAARPPPHTRCGGIKHLRERRGKEKEVSAVRWPSYRGVYVLWCYKELHLLKIGLGAYPPEMYFKVLILYENSVFHSALGLILRKAVS